MESKLNLDFKLVEQARAHAARVADDTQRFIDGCTTVAVERTICRLLGIDGVDASDVPLPSVVVDHLMDKGALPQGAAFWIGNAMVETGKGPQAIAEDVAAYYVESEQVPSACGLGVLIDRDRSVLTAGGYLIQLLPGAGEDVITKVEGGIYAAPSVTNLLKENSDPAVLLKTVLSDFDMEILSVDPIEYRCYCSRERTERALLSLGSKELEKIVDEQGSAELTCQFCDRVQNFTKEDLTTMIADLKKQGK